mmetsp:Transcript_39255/g.71903  ORF Transcript_39255/g.71903 Transcript_39255/m.71903 type:complete len:386 (+) Transcript_39255:64-1221(+)
MVPAEQSTSSEWRRHILAAIIIVSLSLPAWVTNNAPSLLHAHAFSPPGGIISSVARHQSVVSIPILSKLYAETTQSPSGSDNDTDTALPGLNDMRLREIQSELKERNISYADCFDRESLAKRLVEARDGLVLPSIPPPTNEDKNDPKTEPEETPPSTTVCTPKETPPPVDTTATEPIPTTDSASDEFDRELILTKLRSLRVKELKVELSGFNVRWGNMFEKEEMVRALCQAMEERFEQSKNFSRSGELIPGTVVDVEESTLIKELGWLESDVSRGIATTATDGGDSSESASPHCQILLDVYATWCGPCKFLAPLLVEAAEELGPTVRVVKLDSDKYPRISSVLKVGGLPTLIRFDGGDVSKEVQRVEGALTKDQIIDFVNGDFKR